MNDNYCTEGKNVEIPVDQIEKNTKNDLSSYQILMKRGEGIFSRVFLSVRESYMIIKTFLRP